MVPMWYFPTNWYRPQAINFILLTKSTHLTIKKHSNEQSKQKTKSHNSSALWMYRLTHWFEYALKIRGECLSQCFIYEAIMASLTISTNRTWTSGILCSAMVLMRPLGIRTMHKVYVSWLVLVLKLLSFKNKNTYILRFIDNAAFLHQEVHHRSVSYNVDGSLAVLYILLLFEK